MRFPPVLVGGGALVLARELRPPGRPLRTGGICLIAALTLALAAGTLGIGPGALSGHAFWHAAAFESRGGVVGQAEFWVASHLLSTLGADILAVFLFVAGLILVSGATLATVVRATGAGRGGNQPGAAALDRGPRRDRGPATRSHARSGHPGREGIAALDDEPESLLPPEPDTAELIVRATHVEAPPIDDQDGFGDPPPHPGAR